MRWMRKVKIFPILIFLLVGLGSLEIFSYFLVRMKLLLFNETPTFYQTDRSNLHTDWWVERDVWGVWHKPNTKAIQNSSCIYAEYSSNEIGARDGPFSVVAESHPRLLLLGDSMAEGFGVNFEDTAHRQIEKISGFDLLNFGISGGAGPVNYWLLYEHLAKKYQHDGIIIFFMPANDFKDNDYQHYKESGVTFVDGKVERYRPYYKKVGDNQYEYFIPENARKHDNLAFSSNSSEWKWPTMQQFLVDYFWFSNALRTLKVALLGRNSGAGYSGYFDASVEQQKAAVYFIDQIISASEAKNIVLVSIPTELDFRQVKNGHDRKEMLWWKSFATARERLRKPVVFLDLVDSEPSSIEKLFIPCDGHWNPYGNKWAAEIIAAKLKELRF